MAAFEAITTAIDDGIFTLTLNRPDRMNAFTSLMRDEMCQALDLADANDAVRAVIITGAGKAFCAGADLREGAGTFDYATHGSAEGASSPLRADGTVDWEHENVRDSGGRLTLRMFNARKPLIGAINGAAVGIGATMLLPMDFRLASHSARFDSCSPGAESYPRQRLAGFSRAWSGSSRRSTGVIRAECSVWMRRWRAGCYGANTPPKTCFRQHGRWQTN